MTIVLSRACVALVALAVVTVVSTATDLSPVGAWLGVAAVALAAVMVGVRAVRPGVALALAGGALVVGSATAVDSDGSLARVSALATLPTVVALVGLAVVRGRASTAVVLVGAVVAGPVRALGYDPFLDPDCRGCRHLPTLVPMSPGTAALVALAGGLVVVAGLAAGLVGSGGDRWALVGLVGAGLWSLRGWSDVAGTVPAAQAAAAAVGIASALVVLVETGVARGHLARLSSGLASGTAPQASLRRALGDDALVVDFAVDPDTFVDADGLPSPGPEIGQVTTAVTVSGQLVARVHHAPDAGRADRLAGSLTHELRLALEHARLTARLESQVRLLQASRTRVVEAADDARRRLERDLHDGAQQELLALGFDVRRTLAAFPEDEHLVRCVAEVGHALDDLRALASGVHPALLTAAGLGPALEQAGRTGPGEVRVDAMPAQRLPAAVERTAYLLVVDVASRAPVSVRGAVIDRHLTVRVAGPGLSSASAVPERVAALGGSLVEGPGWTEVRIPCE